MEKSNHIYDHKLFPKKRRNASGKKNAPPYRPYDFDDFLSDVGNREIARLFGAGDAAAKLKVGDPGDPKEREADKIANEVVKTQQPSDPGSVQKQAGISDSIATSAANRKAADLMGSGKQLNSNLKSYFEPRFGVDLDKVRIHTDEKANRLSAYIHARALALGNDIAFAKGEYKPETPEGKKLLAHEIAHTIQKQNPLQKQIFRRKLAEQANIPDTSLIMAGIDRPHEHTNTEDDTLDSKLDEAYAQNGLDVDAFMDNRLFNTTGSFGIAYKLYTDKKVSLDRLFESEKIHAGSIQNFEVPENTALVKLALFSEYLKDDIANAEGLMKEYIIDPNYKAYDHRAHFLYKIMCNRTRDIAEDIQQVIALREPFAKAMKLDKYEDDAVEYTDKLNVLKSSGVLYENILDPYQFGGGTAQSDLYTKLRNDSEQFVLNNKNVYLQRVAIKKPSGEFADYVCFDPKTMLATDTATVFKLDNIGPYGKRRNVARWLNDKYAMNEGTFIQPTKDLTLGEWKSLRTNFYILQDRQSAYNRMQADFNLKYSNIMKKPGSTTAELMIEMEKARDKLNVVQKEIETLKPKSAYNVTTFCNFNYSVYNKTYTGNTMFLDGKGFNVWMQKLKDGKYDDSNGKYIEVTEAYAGYWAANNGLAFAIEPTHVAPIIGYDRDPKTKDISFVYGNNVGQDFGYKNASNNNKGFPTEKSFGRDRKPNTKYYIYVPVSQKG